MKTTAAVFFFVCITRQTNCNGNADREPQSRSLINTKLQNALLGASNPFASRPSPKQSTVDPQVQVDQNITFYNIGCVVGRSCSHIIQPNISRVAKPTFKPYTRDDHEHYKGTLDMLYPPRSNGAQPSLHSPSMSSLLSKIAATTTPKPWTTAPIQNEKQTPPSQKNIWVVKPTKKPLPSSKEDKKTAVINNLLSILSELGPYYSSLSAKNDNKVEKTSQDLMTTMSTAVNTVNFKPKPTKSPENSVVFYRSPPKNIFKNKISVTESKGDESFKYSYDGDKKRPVGFQNNQPVYSFVNEPLTPTTTKPGFNNKLETGPTWYQALLDGTNPKVTQKPKKQFDFENPWTKFNTPIKPSTTERPEYDIPVSSYSIDVGSDIQPQRISNRPYKQASIEKVLRPSSSSTVQKLQERPLDNLKKTRPNIITAQDLREKQQAEEQAARQELLKKQQFNLKPFVVSTSFGFDSKNGRSIDLDRKASPDPGKTVSSALDGTISAQLSVLPSRGRSLIREVGGHAIETDYDSTNLTALIFQHERERARSLRDQTRTYIPHPVGSPTPAENRREGMGWGFIPLKEVNYYRQPVYQAPMTRHYLRPVPER